MNHKRLPLPNALPGWRLEEDLHVIDGEWTRVSVTAQGPQHASGRWNKLFQGDDAEEKARGFMKERNGIDPADMP